MTNGGKGNKETVSILKKAREWRDVEALLRSIEASPGSAEAGSARDELLQIAGKWRKAGQLYSALSLFKRLMKVEEQFAGGGKLPKASIHRMWGTAPAWESQKRISRRRSSPVKELGITGLITWPFALGRSVLERIRDQVDIETKPEKRLEEDLVELRMRYEMEEIAGSDFRKEESRLLSEIDNRKGD